MSAESTSQEVRKQMADTTGFSESLWKQLAETGLLSITVDEAHGGLGLGMIEQALVLEEMGRAAYPGPYFATVVLAATALVAGGDRAQLDAYLPGIAEGTLKATLALNEDRLSAGPEGIALRARSQGGEYVLAGVKRFVPFAHVADVILVAARTSESPSDPAHGVTIFALDKGAEGLTIEPNVMIDQTNKVSTLSLENVRVGRDAVVGQVDGGWKILE